jgi:Rrf2 family protein
VVWPVFPKRLQSALKGLYCLAQSGVVMQSQEIAEQIGVSKAETAKVLQLLVWGGFVTSRRGSKGGFHLVRRTDQIRMGEVIDFFLSHHPSEPDDDFVVMRVFRRISAPCQRAFNSLTLADIAARGTKAPDKALRKSGVKWRNV